MNKPIATFFPHIFCSRSKEITSSWSDLFDELKDVKSYRIKNNAPLIKLAKFGRQKSSKGSLRHDENLVELWGIEGDYDGGAISINEAGKLLEKHNIRAILYSTWSCTFESPRWRVLVPLSKPFPKKAHYQMLSRLNGALGGILAPESFTVAQAYFIGRNPNQPYSCICTFGNTNAGSYIDLLESLDQISIGREEKFRADIAIDKLPSNSWLLDLLDGQDINRNALRLVGRMVAKGLDDQTIRDTFEGWQDELTEKRGAERVADLFGGELERMIKGARDKGFAPKTLDDVLSDFRKLSAEDLRKNGLDLVVHLSKIDRSTALQELSRLTGIKLQTLKQALRQKDDDLKQEHRNSTITSRVGERFKIIYLPENIATTADRVEVAVVKQSSDFELAKFAKILVRVVVEEQPYAHYADSELPPAPTVQTDAINKTKLLPLVERAVVFQSVSDKGQTSNIAVPIKVLDHILDNPKTIPSISAMVTHPVVTAKGRIISEIGIDRETGLLLYGNHVSSFVPYSKDDSIKAIARIKSKFLNGFEFSSELDKAAGLSLLFTAMGRKLMSAAPGGLVSAAQQSTGKTTFVKIMHVILTGRDLPVMSWPEGNEPEAQKMLLSTLLRSPELICFDNVGDGLTFKSATLSLTMTSPFFEGRVLGLSRDASVPTNVMLTITGNNIKLANDEVHRWIKVNLTTSNPSPHKRNFQHPDVLNYGLSIRDEVIRDYIGITAGYLQQKERIKSGSRFSEWDKLVRQPLMWAGELDVGQVFDENMEQSAELGARIALLSALDKKFNGAEFRVAELLDTIGIDDPSYLSELQLKITESLRALLVKDVKNDLSVGHGLGKLINIPVLVLDSAATLTLTCRIVQGLKRYKVESEPLF